MGGLRYFNETVRGVNNRLSSEIIRMKRFFAIQGCIAVFWAFLLGPFTHMHELAGHDDYSGEDGSAIVHSHISFDAPDIVDSSQTYVRQPWHGRERQLAIFDFQKQNPVLQPSLMTYVLHIFELTVRDYLPEIPDPVAHAPPRMACFGLRSPPA